MEYVNLGRTGLKVSRLCLGCMSFGDTALGGAILGMGVERKGEPPIFSTGAGSRYQLF